MSDDKPIESEVHEELERSSTAGSTPRRCAGSRIVARTTGTIRPSCDGSSAAWDLLDRLPRTTVNDSFTKTTIELVALSAEAEAVKRRGTSAAPGWKRFASAWEPWRRA